MNQEIITKLQKILARADTSRGATVAETETAMALAQELAAKHNLDLATVMASMSESERQQALDIDHIEINYKSREHLQHKYIRRVLMICFDVKILMYGHNESFVMVGEKTDVQIAQYAFRFLDERYTKLLRDYIRDNYGPSYGYGNSAQQRGFYNGLSHGIIEKNRKVKEQVEGDSMALVLRSKDAAIGDKFKELFGDVPVRKEKNDKIDQWALVAGYKVGKTIKLAAGEIQS